jgi:hypothetical protein
MSIEWAAGLFEGEGTITRDKRCLSFELKMHLTDLDVLHKLQATLGCGSIHPCRTTQKHHKPIWRWRVSNRKDIYRVLSSFLPYLGLRRSYKAINVLEDIELLAPYRVL